MALGAVYVPLILVGQSVMSEPLFVLCMLGAIAAALRRWALLAGVLMGLAILGRANAIDPAAAARGRGLARAEAGASCWCVAAALTVVPWTIRNAIVLDHFVPVSTQFGSALAGTYNSEARADQENPASWRSLKRVDDYQPIFSQIRTTNEAVLEKELRDGVARVHQGAPGVRGEGRVLDDAADARPGRDGLVDPHRVDDQRRARRAAIAGVICFWIFAVLAVIGAFTQRARAAPLWFWAVPLLMYLSVVFLVVETPRYRTAIDPFIVLLAALALTRASGAGRADRCPTARRRAAPRATPPRRRGRARSARARTRARRTGSSAARRAAGRRSASTSRPRNASCGERCACSRPP